MKIAIIEENEDHALIYFDFVSRFGQVRFFATPKEFLEKGEFFDFIICNHRFSTCEDWTSVFSKIDPLTEMFVVTTLGIKDYKENEFNIYSQIRAIDKFPNVHHVRKDDFNPALKILELRTLKEETLRISKQAFPK